MLLLENYFTGESEEFKDSTELKAFLRLQNPTILKKYIVQLKKLKPELKIAGVGTGLRIYR